MSAAWGEVGVSEEKRGSNSRNCSYHCEFKFPKQFV